MSQQRPPRQIQLLFTPANGVQPHYGETWRNAFAARLGAKPGVPPAHLQLLFHHDESGKTAQGKAPVCFIASTKWVGVVATGDAAAAVLSMRMMDLVLAAQDLLGPCAVEHHDLELGAEFAQTPYSYKVRSFVGNEGDKDWTPLRIRDKLVRSLNEWALAHGLKQQFDAADVMIENIEPLRHAAQVNPGQHSTLRSRAAVTFYTPWKLKGMWFLGSQASKGHGLVRFAMGGTGD